MANELPDGSNIKLIVTDLDGTLLNSEGKVSEKTKIVVSKVLEKYPNLHFVIATGRTRNATLSVREALGITNRPNTESLVSNGCVVYDSEGEVIIENILPTEFVIKFHNIFKPYPRAVFSYTYRDGLVAFDEVFAKKAREIIQENIFVEKKDEYIKEIESGKRTNINKVSYFSFGLDMENVFGLLEELGKEYNLEYAKYNSFIIEYMPPQTNKGTSLAQLIKKLNISKDEVLAFGDGGNDIQLLQNVGWPVAMENACDELKPFAKLTAKSNKEDGVACMLEEIFLKEEHVN